jgi:DNA-binding GntR family transcriptional regulator
MTDEARAVGRARRQLGDEVADHVREQIVSGRLAAGEFIRLDRIAEVLNLSPTPVREGLVALRGEGLVTLLPRRGFVVAALSGADVRDLFAGQALLAGELAARATTRLDATDLEILRTTHDELCRVADLETDRVETLNHEFHRRINRAADAPRLTWMLSVATRFAPRRFFASIPGWPAASAKDHHAVLSALAEKEAAAARAAMQVHIENAGNLLAAHFDRLAADRVGVRTSDG